MGASGIFNSGAVVFYHPLDDFTEHTQSQLWSGSGGFVNGKIGDGLSAIAADSFAAGSLTLNASASHHTLARLDDSKLLISYWRGAKYSLRVGTLTSSGTVDLGPETQYVGVPGSTGRADLLTIDSTTALMSYRGSTVGNLHVVTVSGTTVTVGATTNFAPVPRGTRLAKLDDTHAALMYSKNNGGIENGEATIVTISGTTTTLGAAYEFDTGLAYESNSIVAITPSSLMLSWAVGVTGKTVVATVSGTTITFGAEQDLSPAGSEINTNMVLLDSETVFISYLRNGANLMGRIASVSGSGFTFGAEAQLTAAAAGMGLARLSSTEVAYTWRSGSPGSNMTKASVSGTDITFGATTQYDSAATASEWNAVGMSYDTIVAAHTLGGDGYLGVGTLSFSSNTAASIPGAYPATSGSDRVVASMWVNKLGADSSVITVNIDYSLVFTSGYISIGPDTSIWSGSGVTDLLAVTASGEHWLAVDFEHVESGSWNLKTSLDGAEFVEHGSQTSGTRTISPSPLTPEISLVSGVPDQWVDEVIMWAGDKDVLLSFTTQELQNLYELGNTEDLGMNFYDETYVWTSFSGSCDLFTQGGLPSSNNSCDLFINSPSGPSGILDSDNIIFYHPLDDFIEYTQGQLWVGSGGFVDGKIGDGLSAIAAESFVSSPTTINATAIKHTLARLDDSRFLLSYHRAGKYSLRVGTTSSSGITLGPETQYVGVPGSTGRADLLTIDSTTVLMSYRGATVGQIHVVTVSGTDVTVGATTNFAPVPRGTRMAKLDSTHAALMYSKNDGGAEIGEATIITISGTTTTVGAAYEFDAGLSYEFSSIVAISPSSFMLSWSAATSGKTAIATVSGTNITFDSEQNFTSEPTGTMSSMVLLDSETVYIAYVRNLDELMGRIASVSGSNFTFGPELQLTTATADGIGLARLSSTEIAYTWRTGDPGSNMTKAIVTGTDIAFGATTQYHDLGTSTGFDAIEMSSHTIVAVHHVGGNGYLSVGTISLEPSMTSPVPDVYPAASGNDRVGVAMWANRLGVDSSIVTISRDYSIAFTSGYISLGPNAAIWSGSGVTDLLAVTASGEHWLAVDFEHVESGSWNLKTSLDGAEFVEHGSQTSGTRTTSPSSSAPEISLVSGVPDQWIDEVAMWAGDKDVLFSFTIRELQNLDRLGSVEDLGMNFYDQTYPEVLFNDSCNLFITTIGPVIASGNLFIEGSISGTSFQVSGDLFIRGITIAPAASGELAKPLDWLLKTSDHYPQIIGTFVTPANSVTIQVWDITDGQNVSMSVLNSGCYSIGDTGRWGWSTSGLPVTQGYSRHYFYLMTSDAIETFDGQFFMEVPENAKWIHPGSQDDYLRLM